MPTRKKILSLLNNAFCHDDGVMDCGSETKYQESDNDADTEETVLTPANNFHPLRPNPLLNSVVVKRLFHYLKFVDLKNLRSVCQEWNSVAQPLLRKRAKIVIKKNRRGPLQFLTTFRRSSSQLPFTHFVFSEECDFHDAWIFFCKYGKNIRSLKCDGVNIVVTKENGERKVPRNTKRALWAKCNNLSDLHVNCRNGTVQFIPVEDMASVKNLTLEDCGVILKNDVKLSPSTVCLLSVIFLVDITKRPEPLILNDAFDFSNTTTIHIHQSRANPTFLDVSRDIVKVEKMTLFSVSIMNWEKSQWKINDLWIDHISFVDKITINITNLKITNFGSELQRRASTTNTIDLSVMPSTLERLSLNHGRNTEICYSDSVELPHLKYLTILISAFGKPLPISFFSKCPNLVSISLRGYSTRKLSLDLIWLPKTIRKLEIENVVEIIDSRENSGELFPITTLILYPGSFLASTQILQCIQPEVLALCFERCEFTWGEVISCVQHNHEVKKVFVKSSYPLFTTTERTGANWLSKLLDRPLFFNVFENQILRPTTQERFDASMNI